jgi:predicted NAD/FAD-binding protein
MRNCIRLSSPVRKIRRSHGNVEIVTDGRAVETFDRVVIATHSDQALRLLADPTPAEREILGAIPYQRNDAVLHTDESVLPESRHAWSAWNYRIPRDHGPTVVTYDMNILQGLDSQQTFCVTLNDGGGIDPARVLKRIVYHHPLFTADAIAAQGRRSEISGVNRTHYAGAYWGYGFHEDGVRSALDVAAGFGLGLDALVPQIAQARRRNDAAAGVPLAS